MLVTSIVALLVLVVRILVVHATWPGKVVLSIRGRGIVHRSKYWLVLKQSGSVRPLTHDRPSRHVDCDMVSWLVVTRGMTRLTNKVGNLHNLVAWYRQMVFVALDASHNFHDVDIAHPSSGPQSRRRGILV